MGWCTPRRVEDGVGVVVRVGRGGRQERRLRVALLLQVGDDGVPRELRLSDDAHDALELLAVQRELEAALGQVERQLEHL